MQNYLLSELYGLGGPGRFYFSRAEVLSRALADEFAGKVTLIYLDPPFGTGDVFRVRLPGERSVSLPAYADRLPEDQYLSLLREVLTACRELLAPDGSIYVHIDYRMSAQLRLIMDDVFGKSNFLNEIIWSYKTGGRSVRHYPRKHDTILFYRKSNRVYFDITAVGKPRGGIRRNHMKRFVNEKGEVCFSIRSGGKTYVYNENEPVFPTDVWTDIEHLQQKDRERVGYATQKPEALLERIIRASSRPGDLVLDLFSGSGTTAAVAQRLGRRFLVGDASPYALFTLRNRLLLQAGSSRELLPTAEQDSSLVICYPDEAILPVPLKKEDLRMKKPPVLTSDGGGAALVFESLTRPDGHAPLCVSSGTVENGVFRVLHTESMPSFPLRMRIPDGGETALQITALNGRIGWFSPAELMA